MINIILILVYLAFISLGLPDSLLGSAWPVSHRYFGVELSSAAFVSLVSSGSTILSSLVSGRILQRFKTIEILIVSITLTIIGLMGTALAPNFYVVLLFAIPFGLGAGNIDASLNHFVALHFESKHMSWLHSFWGIGASIGPFMMSLFLAVGTFWQGPYFIVSIVQLSLLILMILSRKIWVQFESKVSQDQSQNRISNRLAMKQVGVKFAMLSFISYVAMEGSAALWVASYLVKILSIHVDQAAATVAIFFASLTIGRMLDGFLAIKFSNFRRLLVGQCIGLIGIVLLMWSQDLFFARVALILMGFGFAPSFPIMMHETPVRFGQKFASAVIGLQMASAYVGFLVMPILIGQLEKVITLKFLPYFMFTMMIILIASSLRIQSLVYKKNAKALD